MWVCVLCMRDGVSWCLTMGSRCVVYTMWVCVLCLRDGVSWCLTMGSRCVVDPGPTRRGNVGVQNVMIGNGAGESVARARRR